MPLQNPQEGPAPFLGLGGLSVQDPVGLAELTEPGIWWVYHDTGLVAPQDQALLHRGYAAAHVQVSLWGILPAYALHSAPELLDK